MDIKTFCSGLFLRLRHGHWCLDNKANETAVRLLAMAAASCATIARSVSTQCAMHGVEVCIHRVDPSTPAEHGHLLRAFLESSPSLYLGKLSFTMYIYHNIAQYALFDYAPYGKSPTEVYADPALLVTHALATLGVSIAFGMDALEEPAAGEPGINTVCRHS